MSVIMNIFLCNIVFFLAVPLCQGQLDPLPLEQLNIDLNAISTSGISAGACMATQFHVAYSASVMGVGMVAGAAYWCAQGSALTANAECMKSPAGVDVTVLQDQAAAYSSSGDIDPTSSMNGHAVWVFAGTQDSVVVPGEAAHVEDFYSIYTSKIQVVDTVDAEHTFPTVDMGNGCLMKASPYIGRCSYDGAYELLNYIYGGSLVRPDRNNPPALTGTFREFDQKEFFYTSLPAQSSMDTIGFIYIPSGCESALTPAALCTVEPAERVDCGVVGVTQEECSAQGCCWDSATPGVPWCFNPPTKVCTVDPGQRVDCGFGGITEEECSTQGCCWDNATPGVPWCFNQGTSGATTPAPGTTTSTTPPTTPQTSSGCKLHVVFHGCSQQRGLLDDQFAMESGYNEVGELNNIVMLYPQTVASAGNTFGCWDWWGYTIPRYATKGANQPLAVARMVDKICGTTIAPK